MLNQDLALSDYILILRRRWWLIVLAAVGLTVFSLVWSLLQPPKYQSTVRVLVDAASSAEIFDPVTGQARGARLMTNESAFAESFQVAEEAKRRLASDDRTEAVMAQVSATESSDADVLLIRANASTANDAALAAQTYAEAYIFVRRQQVVGGLSRNGRGCRGSRADRRGRA